MHPLPTLSDLIATHARLTPHRLGARDSRRDLTWSAWDARASRLAQALLGLGLRPGDRVALLGWNAIEWLELYVALARARLVAVPVNFRLKGPEIAYIVQHSQARAIVAQDDLCEVVDGVRGELSVAAGGFVRFGAGRAAGWRDYEDLIAAAASRPPELPASAWTGAAPAGVLQADAAQATPDLAALMYTSGTTGRPKGAMRSHQANALITWATAVEFGLSRRDTALLVMPLCHANSLYFALTFAMLGAAIVVDDRRHFEPEAVLRQLAHEGVTFTSLVPTHYAMMLDLPSAATASLDLSRVGRLLISSAPAREATKRAVMELFPNGRLFELYGSTEAGWVTVLRPDEQLDHLGSVGREWAGSSPIRLLDDAGREVPDGEVGELHSRTAYAFDGYWGAPDKTREALKVLPACDAAAWAWGGGPGPAWCTVGDLARRDADGFIHLVDRKSHMIITGGENVYPAEVEAVVAAHPSVQDVAVVGLPDATWGERVTAVVVPRPGLEPDLAELDAWCRQRIAGYKRPRGFCIVQPQDMPRTATGKIQHRLLRQRLAEAPSVSTAAPGQAAAGVACRPARTSP
ncbi:MAG: AMP-binding protein [Rubrivivax sp.]